MADLKTVGLMLDEEEADWGSGSQRNSVSCVRKSI